MSLRLRRTLAHVYCLLRLAVTANVSPLRSIVGELLSLAYLYGIIFVKHGLHVGLRTSHVSDHTKKILVPFRCYTRDVHMRMFRHFNAVNSESVYVFLLCTHRLEVGGCGVSLVRAGMDSESETVASHLFARAWTQSQSLGRFTCLRWPGLGAGG